jgi:hypothetical protein
VYKYHYDVEIRDISTYNTQVSISSECGQSYEGIKGESILSKWVSIPQAVLLDYMHLSFEGLV